MITVSENSYLIFARDLKKVFTILYNVYVIIFAFSEFDKELLMKIMYTDIRKYYIWTFFGYIFSTKIDSNM